MKIRNWLFLIFWVGCSSSNQLGNHEHGRVGAAPDIQNFPHTSGYTPGSGAIPDGGVLYPLAGAGTAINPLYIADGGIQSPSAVAITGGTIVGTTINGQSPTSAIAENAFLAAALGWQRAQYATMIAAVPALTRFSWMKLGEIPVGSAAGAVTDDGNIEGGGLSVTTIQGFGVGTFQTPTAGNWAIGFRLKVAALASGGVAQFGISSIAGPNTDGIWIGIRYASSTTNFFARIVASGTTTDTVLGTFDANWHDGVITDDGTTVKYWFDGTLVGSTTTRTNIVTTPYQPFAYGAAGSPALVSRVMIGYVQP